MSSTASTADSDVRTRWMIDRVILAIFAGAILIALIFSLLSPMAKALVHGERIKIVLIGSDLNDYSRHSDTLMLLSYDPTTRFLDVLSIPRDTLIHLPGFNFKRINEVFAYHFRTSKRDFNQASLAVKGVVEYLLWQENRPISIPYYFQIDYSCFVALIDAVGGVWVKIEEPMHHDDNWGKLHIHFVPGTYLLDGKRALEYVRYRGKSGDRGRVTRQQFFVKQVLARAKNPMVLIRLPRYLWPIWKGIHTNISLLDFALLALEGPKIDWGNVRLVTLPTKVVAGGYLRVDKQASERIVDLVMGQAPAQAAPASNRPVVDEKTGTPVAIKTITAEVWNASKQPKLAREVTLLLRDKGVDVVTYGNYASRQNRTLVIDRSGNVRGAQEILKFLNLQRAEVVTRIDPDALVDVSVILGDDYVETLDENSGIFKIPSTIVKE